MGDGMWGATAAIGFLLSMRALSAYLLRHSQSSSESLRFATDRSQETLPPGSSCSSERSLTCGEGTSDLTTNGVWPGIPRIPQV